MKFLHGRFFRSLLAVGIFSIRLAAQVAGLPSPEKGPSESASVRHTDESSTNADGGSSGGAPPAAQLVGNDNSVFIIPGVINLEGLSGAGILFGAGVSEGYGWLSGNSSSDPQGSISVVQPYVGLYQSGYRHKILFEYAPTVDLYNQNKFDGSVLERGGLRGYHLLSPRWGWTFSTFTTNGSEYLRELDGLAIGQYAGWLTFAHPSASLLMATGSTALKFHPTPRQIFSLDFTDTYSQVKHGPHYDAGTARLQMTNYFGRDSNWYAYGQATRYSDQPGCTRVGSGAGFIWNLSGKTTISLEGGPEYGSGPCFNHLTANFSGAIAQHFSPWTILYLSAGRDLVEPYLLESRWTDVYSAKLWMKFSQNVTGSIGSAYTRSSTLPGETVPEYRGFVLFAESHWRLSDSLSLVGTYRYFKREIANPGFDDRHTWVFASVVWHPLSRARRRD